MKNLSLLYFLFLLCFLSSCEDYLDEKPDKKLAIPSSLSDLQAILDNYGYMNQAFPLAGEESSDNYYLTSDIWQSLSSTAMRNDYLWQDQGEHIGEWSSAYRTVFNANIVLDELENISYLDSEREKAEKIRSSALFFRSFTYWHLAQIFAAPYDEDNRNGLGIPLRTNADYLIPTKRATIGETYDQIVTDLHAALMGLPAYDPLKSRPTRAAGYGLLARVYLSMNRYQEAGKYADSCLALYNQLMDYNDLDTAASTPIDQFNDEVIFAARSYSESILLYPGYGKVDTTLLGLYDEHDLRKKIFYAQNEDGYADFKGSYDGLFYGNIFMGLATDEILLIRAECRARLGDLAKALEDINILLEKRWKKGTFTLLIIDDGGKVLTRILEERRKELVLRGLRWTDIRRFNKDAATSVTLVRKLNDETIELIPNDLRYVFLIPSMIMEMSDLEQNPR